MTPTRHPLSRIEHMMPLLPAVIAALLLFLLLKAGSVLWWPVAMALPVVALRQHLSRAGLRQLALFWALATLIGLSVELFRLVGGLWFYAPPLDGPAGVAVISLLGYPLMFGTSALMHSALRRTMSGVWALALTIAGITTLSELPNAIVPFWQVPDRLSGFVMAMHIVGYPALISLAIASWATIGHPTRATSTDTRLWRFVRVVMVSLLCDALRRVYQSQEIAVNNAPQRLRRTDADRVAAHLELETAQVRRHVDLAIYPTFGNRLLVEFALFTIAAQTVLMRQGIGRHEADRIVADTGWLIYGPMLRLASLPAHATTRDPAKRLQRTIRQLLRFPFSASVAPGYEVRIRDVPGGIETHFLHFPPQTAARKVAEATDDNAPLECFQQSWCRYDWPGADLIAADGKGGHYSRPRTLSHGDKVCDMCWIGRAER